MNVLFIIAQLIGFVALFYSLKAFSQDKRDKYAKNSSSEELEQYKKHVNDKFYLHKKHGTKLIYTFSKYNDGKDLITLQETVFPTCR